jgi:hypothetical protein
MTNGPGNGFEAGGGYPGMGADPTIIDAHAQVMGPEGMSFPEDPSQVHLADPTQNWAIRAIKSRTGKVAGTGLALAATAGIYAGIGGFDGSPSSSPDVAGAAAPISAADRSDLSTKLEVDAPAVDCVQIVQIAATGEIVNLGTSSSPNYGVKPHIGANDGLAANGAGDRLWSDSLEGPLSNPNDKNLSIAQIEATVCEDPLYGVTLGNMFANMEVDGVKVIDLNPWLSAEHFDASAPDNQINDVADSYFPLKEQNGAEQETTESNAQYQQFAEKLVTLIQRFENDGRATHPTILNYHLSSEGLVAGGTPEVSLNEDQYNADGIWLRLTKKSGGCFVEIGFNVGDQRPEETNLCEVPTTPTTEAQGHPTTTQPNVHVPTTEKVPTTTVTTGPHGSTTTSTTFIGAKQNPHPPVTTPNTPNTTVPPDTESGPTPTTSTTEAPSTTTQPTVPASTSTSTTAPQGTYTGGGP